MGITNIESGPLAQQERVNINDFAMVAATKNGSGSQTSNAVLVRSLFKMGIPVTGKNLFPSNIKGLPTWYTIRASKDGYTARRAITEVVIALNQDTAAEDIKNLPVGGVCILPSEWKWGQSRTDITYYEIPVKDITAKAGIAPDFRDRVANMVYVGAVAQLFNIPMDIIRQALIDNFNGKEKPALMNFGVAQAAYDWTAQNVVKKDAYRFEPMNLTEGKILIEGNEAAALGAIFGGVSVVAWYPITPSTSLVDGIMTHQKMRIDPETGLNTISVVQAEDEIAAIGMIVGAGWAGARSLTATSGPGISLMSEFAGLAYFAEIPCVIWNVTRMGPSTGMPTRTSQGDILFTYFLGHGDSRHLCLIPGSVAECFEYGWRSLNYAEEFQTPVFVLSDLDLGMNMWMSDKFEYPTEPVKHGKKLDKIALEEFFAEHGEWYRYKDYDQDGVGYRTVPGTDHPRAAYFTRGTGHNERAIYSERSEDWTNNMARLHRKFETARATLPRPVVDFDPSKKVGIISYGTNDPAILEARDRLIADGIQTNYLRIRALPLAQEVFDFLKNHDRVYVIENNFDGQMAQLIRTEVNNTSNMVSLPLGDGLPMTARWVHEQVTAQEQK